MDEPRLAVSPAPDAADVAALRRRFEQVHDRIAGAGGDPGAVTVLAVTKGHEAGAVALAREAGLLDLGENYAQELVAKAKSPAAAGVRWHAIGRLQRNKIKALAPYVHLWQSVHRTEEAREVARRAPGAAVLVQVNLTDDPARAGAPPDEVVALVHHVVELGLDVRGLMAVGPPGGPAAAQTGFRMVVDLADRLALPVRSLGMSQDLEVAVAAGSTMVRVGTALFGRRTPQPAAKMEN